MAEIEERPEAGGWSETELSGHGADMDGVRMDLHVHSRRSDGGETVEQVIKLAAEIGLTHLVLTDHDITDRVELIANQVRTSGIQSVTGVELSAFDGETGKKAHILGYRFDQTTHIEGFCAPTRARRHENGLKQIEILQSLGYRISAESVAELAGEGHCIYKQHILDYLFRTGQSDALYGDVYRSLFKNGGPCDISISYSDVRDAVRAIKQDGGLAVLAHPGQQQNLYLVKELICEGLSGVELAHPSNRAEDIEKIKLLCEKNDMFMTGGSDFHGSYERESRPLGKYLADGSSSVIFCEKKGSFSMT